MLQPVDIWVSPRDNSSAERPARFSTRTNSGFEPKTTSSLSSPASPYSMNESCTPGCTVRIHTHPASTTHSSGPGGAPLETAAQRLGSAGPRPPQALPAPAPLCSLRGSPCWSVPLLHLCCFSLPRAAQRCRPQTLKHLETEEPPPLLYLS